MTVSLVPSYPYAGNDAGGQQTIRAANLSGQPKACSKTKKPMRPGNGHGRPGHINSNTKVIKRPISVAYVI